jgi:hypothetical protein
MPVPFICRASPLYAVPFICPRAWLREAVRKHLVIWADAEERDRLRRLRDAFGPGRTFRYPAELTRPKAHPEQKRGRKAKASHDEIHERPGQ